MVECEYLTSPKAWLGQQVLIDTWWNVNHYVINRKRDNAMVLIDTWWNVNN